MNRIAINLLTAALLAVCSCGARQAAAAVSDDAVQQTPEQRSVVAELPLPTVPATLVKPVDRANYIIEHFWDAMDFRDTLRSRNEDFIEQNFVNYASVFPYADPSVRKSAALELLKRAHEADEKAFMLLTDTAEKYLYEMESPMRNEEVYISFLEAVVELPGLDDVHKIRPGYQLEAALKNRPGTTATDFTYITRDGRYRTLRKTSCGDYLLLVFYDPDCEHCKEVMALLSAEPLLDRLVAEGRITVLAVDANGGNRELWESGIDLLPATWTAGLETGRLYEAGLYVLRSMPTLYLLDSHNTVILKEPSPESLIEYLSAN